MKSRLLPIVGALLALGYIPAVASVTLLEKENWKVGFGGFVELDLFHDSTRSWMETPGSTPVVRTGTANGNGDAGRSQMSIRNSRFAFSVIPPLYQEWSTKGYLEFDLLGYNPAPAAFSAAPTEGGFFTNPTLRVRHAYLSAEHGGWQLLAGQYWNLFGWMPAYVLDTVAVPPITGELYSRNPQVRLTKTLPLGGQWGTTLAVAAVRPTERDSEIPNGEAGLRLAFAGWRGPFLSPTGDIGLESLSLGVSATARDIAHPAGGTGQVSHVIGSAVALDAIVPVLPASDPKDVGNALTLSGEITSGKGDGDYFPGWTGNLSPLSQSANPAQPNLDCGIAGYDVNGAFTLVDIQTFNVSLEYHLPTGWNTFVNLVYAQLTSSNVGGLSPFGGIAYDKSQGYGANVFHDVTPNIRVGAEYFYGTTHYVDGVTAHNNRVQLSAWFRI